MGRPKTYTGLPAQQAIRRGERILAQLDADGADLVRMDDTHAYLWSQEQLVNIFDHKDLIRFLEKHGYMRKRTENKMMVIAAVIIEALKRCA